MLTEHKNLQTFFHSSITQAVCNQHVDADDYTIIYLVHLLSAFNRPDRLFDETEEGLRLRPLANHYFDAMQSSSFNTRYRTMQRLGDIALFISGLFADSLKRKSVDIDYYVAMGGSAYAYLSSLEHSSPGHRAFVSVFRELASKFISFADVLAEVVEQMNTCSDVDLLRQYEIWLKTGSRRAEKLLRMRGIIPDKNTSEKRH